jgi:glutathione S-transferase
MKLYNEHNPAPNPRRVRIFLAEKGISMPFVHVPMRQGAHKSAEFMEKNSLGQVPVLELDDGSTLSESIAICRYLEELHPAPALFGNDAWQRARVEMWMRRIEFALLSRIGAVWINTHKYTAHLGTQYKDFGEASRLRSLKAMHWLNDELSGREFLATDCFSMADIVALTTLDFATFIGIETPAELTHLHAWHVRVSARPSAAA